MPPNLFVKIKLKLHLIVRIFPYIMPILPGMAIRKWLSVTV